MKQTKINIKANKKIAQLWIDNDIQFCEVCPVLYRLGHLDWGCLFASSNAHRNNRIWYYSHPERLWEFKQVVRACIPSHNFIDNEMPEIKEQVFIELRGEQPH